MSKKQKLQQETKAESASVQKTAVSPKQKAAQARKAMEKRRKQYRHIMTLIQVAVRIANAAGRSTIYRK